MHEVMIMHMIGNPKASCMQQRHCTSGWQLREQLLREHELSMGDTKHRHHEVLGLIFFQLQLNLKQVSEVDFQSWI